MVLLFILEPGHMTAIYTEAPWIVQEIVYT